MWSSFCFFISLLAERGGFGYIWVVVSVSQMEEQQVLFYMTDFEKWTHLKMCMFEN